jgi:spore protease
LAVTVQISDTGINPGAGVGNRRSEITKASLGVPVVSIGMPTVVNAATLVADASAMIASKSGVSTDEMRDSMYDLAKDALTPYGLNLFVTPKDIDGIISNSARLIGYSINKALQNNMTVDEMHHLLS